MLFPPTYAPTHPQTSCRDLQKQRKLTSRRKLGTGVVDHAIRGRPKITVFGHAKRIGLWRPHAVEFGRCGLLFHDKTVPSTILKRSITCIRVDEISKNCTAQLFASQFTLPECPSCLTSSFGRSRNGAGSRALYHRDGLPCPDAPAHLMCFYS